MSDVIELTDDNFEKEVLDSDKPWLVDFWAEWCGPCLMVAPMIEKIAKEYGEKLKVGKLKVDQNSKFATKYSITSPPSFLFFDKGKVIDQVIGAVSKKRLIHKIEVMIQGKEVHD